MIIKVLVIYFFQKKDVFVILKAKYTPNGYQIKFIKLELLESLKKLRFFKIVIETINPNKKVIRYQKITPKIIAPIHLILDTFNLNQSSGHLTFASNHH